jgi:hypothetical protein
MTRLALCILVVCGSLGCRTPVPLANTYPSPDALGTAVLEALSTGDRQRLEALALNETEFRAHVWPALPAAKPERNLPFSYVWGDLHQKSQLALTRTVREHIGRRYRLARTTFAGETKYPNFTVHRQTLLAVRDDSGAESTLRVCGSMIEKGGSWKVFSYVADD